LTNHQDVADPDQIASGVAGTGQENRNKTGITGKPEANIPQKNCRKNREIIGLGVLYNGPMNAGKIPDTGHSAGKYVPEDPPEGHGDLIFSLYERQERIADRLNKKIERLDRRLTTIEERGRS
jgi:flagellar capping protein FliD